jgi:PST family polysaccharide transporter
VDFESFSIVNASWLRHLPLFIRGYLNGRFTLQSIICNAGWLTIDRLVRLGLNVVLSITLARYLGPEQFGLYSYALSFVGLFASLASFGLDSILVRELVHDPAIRQKIVGTAFIIKLLGGMLAMLIAILATASFRPDDQHMLYLVTIAAASYVFQVGDVADAWNQCRQHNKPSVLIRLLGSGGFFMIKLALIFEGAPIESILMVGVAEALVVTGMFIIYCRSQGFSFLGEFSLQQALRLLSLAWPFIFSGIAIAIYMRIDQVMIGNMLSDSDVGYYGAAARLSEVWYFLPAAIVTAAQPVLLRIFKESEARFMRLLESLIMCLCWLAITIATMCFLFSETLISVVFGPLYLPSAPILLLHVWSGIFVFIGLAATVWMLAHGYTQFSLFQTVVGAALNVYLNYLLIPVYGVLGAAWATLIAYAVVNVAINLCFDFSRPLFYLIVRAALFGPLWVKGEGRAIP